MQFIVCDNYDELSRRAADIIGGLVKEDPSCILGLATGSTPVGTYRELVRRYEAGELDFSRVISYNLDEYYPMEPTHDQSYRYFMNTNLFDHINIKKENTHVPDGLAKDPKAAGAAYDRAIDEAGGIDLQLLGIGQNGHIAFNEPGDTLVAGTHVTGLTENTIQANARFFKSVKDVPTQAISMGMASIMHAKKILMLINGKAKHDALMKLYNEEIDPHCPATLLKLHRDVIIICDKEAYNG